MQQILNTFASLDTKNKALIYLMQVYFIGNTLGNTFLNVFYYNKLDGILGIIEANTLFFASSGIGFILSGLFISHFRQNMKMGFYGSFLLFGISFGLLYFFQSPEIIYLFSILFGAANGVFRCSYHNYQLSYVGDAQRDFFSSISTLGKNFLSIAIPAIVSLIFILTQNASWINGYDIIFILMPFCYLSCLFFIRNLPDSIPQKTGLKEIFSFFHPKEIYQNLFFIFAAQAVSIPKVLIMILVIYILKTEINLGIYQTLLGVISLLITGYFATKRNNENRLKLLWIFAFLNSLSFIFLGYDFNIIILAIFSLVSILITPAFDISQTVFMLKYMSDTKKEEKNFLPKMMFREIILILSRTSFFVIFGYLFYAGFDEKTILKIGIYYVSFVFIATALFATLEEKRLKNIEIS